MTTAANGPSPSGFVISAVSVIEGPNFGVTSKDTVSAAAALKAITMPAKPINAAKPVRKSIGAFPTQTMRLNSKFDGIS
jgi:hypothetical protein